MSTFPEPSTLAATSPSTHPFTIAPADRDERRAQSLRDGYLYLPRLLDARVLAPLRRLLHDALESRGWLVPGSREGVDASGRDGSLLSGTTAPSLALGRWDDTRWFTFLGEVLPSAPYRAIAAHPALVEVMTDVLGAEPELHVGDVCRLVSPGDPLLTTPPHQDAAYLKEAERVWTAWLALVPCPRALGPLAIWAGSHHGGLRPHAPVVTGGGVVGTTVPDDVVWTTGDLALGDVVLFSSLTVHRALDNVTADQLRVSVDYRYRPRVR
ncbi:MAG: phytanoyl-CoA dioxygenase family protein [Kofleriaceae bacterium]